MTIQEIKQAVDAGKTVNWVNGLYEVRKDRYSRYLIVCTSNGYTIGLTNLAGDKLNGEENEFFIAPEITDYSKTESV